MTVAANYAPIVAAANGSTTQFSGSWNAIAAANLVVQLLNTTTGVYTPVTQGVGASQYQVTSLTASGFVITFNTAPVSGNNVVISRNTSQQQTVPYTTSRGFQGSVEEGSFDSLTAMVQELNDLIGNAIQVPVGDTAATLTLPIVSLRASAYLGFDANGNVIAIAGQASVPVSPAMAPVVEATTLAAARTAMGVASSAVATSSTPGLVQPDGTVITVDGSGHITVPTSTASTAGVVKPDGSSITAAAGVLTANYGIVTALGVGSFVIGSANSAQPAGTTFAANNVTTQSIGSTTGTFNSSGTASGADTLSGSWRLLQKVTAATQIAIFQRYV